MNKSPLLIVSVVLNIGLAALLVARWQTGSLAIADGEGSHIALRQSRGQNIVVSPNLTQKKLSRPRVEDKATASLDWHQVESEDYKQYIANLRAIGCPEKTIRDIIVADVNELFASRLQALTKPAGKFEYWKANLNFMAGFDEEKMKQQQELAKEKRALLKELLGVEVEEKPGEMMAAMLNPFDSMLDFLPAEKRTKLMELEQQFSAKQMKLFSGGALDADDQAVLKKLQAEKTAELAKFLSPEELENYELRMSQTAMTMRFQLAGFDPNEKEFRDIFSLRKKFDEEFSPFGFGNGDEVEQKKRTSAQQELDSQLKSLLGDKRYGEYQRGQDFTYQSIARIAEKNGLPKEAAAEVYDMKSTVETQVNRLRADSSLSEAKRNEALEAIRAETLKAITETLGEKGAKSLQQQPGGFWLKNLGASSGASVVTHDAVFVAPAVPVPGAAASDAVQVEIKDGEVKTDSPAKKK